MDVLEFEVLAMRCVIAKQIERFLRALARRVAPTRIAYAASVFEDITTRSNNVLVGKVFRICCDRRISSIRFLLIDIVLNEVDRVTRILDDHVPPCDIANVTRRSQNTFEACAKKAIGHLNVLEKVVATRSRGARDTNAMGPLRFHVAQCNVLSGRSDVDDIVAVGHVEILD